MSKQTRKQGNNQGSPETDMHEQHVKAEQQRHQRDTRQTGAQASKDSRGQASPNSDSARATNDGLDDRYFSKTESSRDSSKDEGKNR